MRKILAPSVAVAALLWIAAPAVATPPVFTSEHVEYGMPPAPYGASCDGFDVVFTASADHSWTDFFDKAGDPTFTTLHFSFTGTLYNSADLTKNVPYWGRGFWTWDWRDGHWVDTMQYAAMIDGHRVQINTGQDVYNWDPEWFVWHGIDGRDVLCEALS